jgi:Ca-activated chloride channel family protein
MNRTTVLIALRALCLLLVAGGSYGIFAQAATDKTHSPYFFVRGDPQVDQLPLKETRVDISVSGVIADIRVIQTYRNEGKRAINATYVFPASTRAAVYSMRMKIGDQIISAKIKERERAEKEFEQAKKEGKSASLLEQNRPNVFSMSLANIMPLDQIEIELRYTELLVPTDGTYEVVFPTVVGPRYVSDKESTSPKADGFVESPYLQEEETPNSTLSINTRISAGLPIRELTCPSHKVAPEWLDSNTANLSLEETAEFQGNRDFVLRYRLSGEGITSGLLLFQGEDENFFLFMAQPPARVANEDLPPREYIFVIDVSGSMEGFPLETATRLLTDLIGNLKPTDYFNLVLFAGDSTALSESSLPANQENVSRAIDLLERQRGSGGTELLAALTQAMNIPKMDGVSRSVVLVTDGYVSGEQGVFDHIRANLGQSNVFAFGIGSSVNRYLIEGIATAGMGEPFVVTESSEAAQAAVKFREYIQNPALTDVRVNAEGFDVYDVQPLNLPDLLARRPVILFGKWRGPVTGRFELQGLTGRGNYKAGLDVAAVTPDESNSALRYLWARARIAELSDYGIGNPSGEKIAEVTALGLKYNLLTKYTSFIAIRETIVNPNAAADTVKQPLPLPLGVSMLAVGSEPEMVWLLSALAVAALILLVRRRTGFRNA